MTIDLKGRRIALIGGAGFIGHNLALALAEAGALPTIVDGLQINNYLSFASSQIAQPERKLYLGIIDQRMELLRKADIPLYAQDARDYHQLSCILEQIKPQVIIHLAAIAHAGKANKDPFNTFDHSLRTLENALDAARGVKAEHFIYFSSSMVYGNFKTEEVNEEHPLDPIGIYGALKVGGEKIVIAYQQVFDLPYTIIRPSALYGQRCVSRRVGQIFIESALRGNPLQISGDGKEKLDFTYIDDLVSGVLLIIARPNARNQVFNMTYGQSRSVNDLVAILKETFPDARVDNTDRDKLMPFRGTLSVKKARQLLGYNPQNPIEVGFSKYIQWYRDLQKEGKFS